MCGAQAAACGMGPWRGCSKRAELCKAKSQRQSGALASCTGLSWMGNEGSGSSWCSEGLHVIAREETCLLAQDAFTPSIRVPPCDVDEGPRLEGELVVLLPCVRVEGQHCAKKGREAMEQSGDS